MAGGAISIRFLLEILPNLARGGSGGRPAVFQSISNRNPSEICPGAAPAAGRPFSYRFLIEVLREPAPGRLRAAGGGGSIRFPLEILPNLARGGPGGRQAIFEWIFNRNPLEIWPGAAPTAGRPFFITFFIIDFGEKSFQIWPGAAPAARRPFFNQFLIEILQKSAPERPRRPGGHFRTDF